MQENALCSGNTILDNPSPPEASKQRQTRNPPPPTNFQPLNWLPNNDVPTTQAGGSSFSLYDHDISIPGANNRMNTGRRGYNNSDSGGEMDLSPVSGSNRLTPNSTAPSDTRTSVSGPNNNSNNNNNTTGSGGPGSPSSHPRSYETSPAMPHRNLHHPSSSANTVNNATTTFSYGNNGVSNGISGVSGGGGGGSGSVHDYGSLSGSGLTPGPFGIGDVSDGVGSRDFVVPSWESGGSGMTPVGEGMLGQLMGVGGMEMGWDGEMGRDR